MLAKKHQRNSSLKPPFFSLSLEGPFLVAGSRTQEFFCSVDLTIRQVTKKKRQSRFFPGGKEREGGRRPKSLSNDELSFLCWDCIKNLLLLVYVVFLPPPCSHVLYPQFRVIPWQHRLLLSRYR